MVAIEYCLGQSTIAESDRLSYIARFNRLLQPFNSASFEGLDKASWLGPLPLSQLLGAGTRKYIIVRVREALKNSGARVVKQSACIGPVDRVQLLWQNLCISDEMCAINRLDSVISALLSQNSCLDPLHQPFLIDELVQYFQTQVLIYRVLMTLITCYNHQKCSSRWPR